MLDQAIGQGPEAIFEIAEPRAGLRAFVVIDSTLRGPAFGGIRVRPYAAERDALLDALDLAAAMTVKAALADLPCGGGKIVVLDGPLLRRALAMAVLGRAVEDLGGCLFVGRDLGMSARDLQALRRATRFAADESPAAMGDLGDATARGAVSAIRAALHHARGAAATAAGSKKPPPEEILCGARIAVQGAGSGAGAEVLVADPAREAARRAGDTGATIVAPERRAAARADVFVPAAAGSVVDDAFARRCRARIVCGPANNAVASRSAEETLRRRGVVLVPDPIVGAGALIVGVLHHLGRARRARMAVGADHARAARRVGDTGPGRGARAAGIARHGVRAGARDVADDTTAVAGAGVAIDAIGPRTERFLREVDRTGLLPSEVMRRMALRRLRARTG